LIHCGSPEVPQTMMLLSNCFVVSLPSSHMAVTWETVGVLYLL
jgi:hypothetical protein